MKAGRKGALILALVLAVVTGLTSVPAAIAAERVVLVDFSWSSVQVHDRIAGFILEHGYGFSPEYLFAESVPGLTGLQQGDVDIAMEVWVDNLLEWYTDAVEETGEVLDLGSIFPDAPQGWYVPAYMIKGDEKRGIKATTPDLKSVFDLPKYWEAFKDTEVPGKGRFYNAIPGWVVHDINLKKLETYGLSDSYTVFDPGSQMALQTAIVSAYEKGQPVLAYYWEPEWIMGLLDMVMLEEPPYDPDRWGEGKDYGCAFPAARVHKGINTKFAEKHPEVVEFLEKYETTLAQNNGALAFMEQEEATVEEAAAWFLTNYKDVWKSWLPGDVAGKVEAALAKL